MIAIDNNVIEKKYVEVGIASIKQNNQDVIIDIYCINQVPIAGFQFEIQPDDLFSIDSISGGISEEVGFTLYSNKKGILLGFSLVADEIPKSISNNINDNILFSAYGKKISNILVDVTSDSTDSQEITLKTTLASKKGNKINAKVNKYVYKND